jgi:hypothetical protein
MFAQVLAVRRALAYSPVMGTTPPSGAERELRAEAVCDELGEGMAVTVAALKRAAE